APGAGGGPEARGRAGGADEPGHPAAGHDAATGHPDSGRRAASADGSGAGAQLAEGATGTPVVPGHPDDGTGRRSPRKGALADTLGGGGAAVPPAEGAPIPPDGGTGRRGPRKGAVADTLGGGAGGRRDTGQARRPGTGGGGRSGVVGSIGAWARRRLGGPGRGDGDGDDAYVGGEADALRERWPDPAAVLLTALGPGRRLWERAPEHPDALTVRLGTADLPSESGTRRLAGVPFTVDLRDPRTAALTLAGPRPRLAGLARAVLAQLCALHSPTALEVVLLSADRTRPADQRAEEWSWLNWLPHVRPSRGQDCRLLLAFDHDQAQARTAELLRRIEEGPAAGGHQGPYALLVVDGDPGSAALRGTVARIAAAGPAVGVHVLCLTEPGEHPAVDTGVVARLSGDVTTTLRVEPAGQSAAAGRAEEGGADEVVLDAVSAAWAEHFARALAPLREADADAPGAGSRHALPASVRLLDELDLALATPAKIAARWAAAPPASPCAVAVLGSGAGAGTGGRVAVDLVAEGPHMVVGGAQGAGKTELLRSVAAALAAGERPERLALILLDGAGQERGEGLAGCADLPHVSTHLVASDPVRMREFAQALTAELKRREQVLGGKAFATWHAERLVTASVPHQGGRPAGTEVPEAPEAPALPRLVVLVDDFDALVAPALGAPGRPAAGSVVRAVEAVARDGERLGVHLVTATGRPERTAGTDADERAPLRVALRMPDTESAALLVHVEDPAGLDEAVPGRGYLRRPGGAVTAFQAGRVSGRIPRTATLRPTVVGLEWERMGDPPARRQVRELGNGPTDLALLASALERANEVSSL
ncbi:FtsK/SpoIIIE domain-containing protein, partial [Actinacidiphila bryophytorum]